MARKRIHPVRTKPKCTKHKQRQDYLRSIGALKAKSVFAEIERLGHDEDYEPKLEPKPTAARAGSWEKISELASRVERGEWLWHPGDNQMSCTTSEMLYSLTMCKIHQKLKYADRVRG